MLCLLLVGFAEHGMRVSQFSPHSIINLAGACGFFLLSPWGLRYQQQQVSHTYLLDLVI